MCGCTCAAPTVYDLAHVGNARPVVVYDVLARLLRRLYPRVTYVRNITDVDDKINARAQELGEPIAALTARTTADFHADMAALGALPPDIEPRATAHIAEMIAIIERLIAAGHAYAAEGHVLFAVASLSRTTASCPAAARTNCWPARGSTWRRTSATRAISCCGSRPRAGSAGLGQPWGRGRPGWHIECSAMSWRYLGETFDIHGGGTDLIFPHHENEMAQSLLRLPRQPFRALLGAQRHAAGERREDVEEPRQLHHAARRAGAGAGRGDPAAAAAHALPLDARFHRCGAGRGAAGAGPVLSRAGALPGAGRCRRAGSGDWRRCATT